MNNKSEYKTKQKAELTAYLRSMSGQHFTVNDVCHHFSDLGRPIGVTTVYRQLDKMVEEGIVNKYTLDNKSSACYEYIDAHDHYDSQIKCYHCKCDKCGKLIHLHCEEVEGLIRHISGDHGFVINPKRTVFYGICKECQSQEHI